MARILIVGGGCRGRRLAAQLVHSGHSLRVTTRSEEGRGAVEATGAECWIGTPDRLATLRGSLDSVTVACWMLAGASGDCEQVAALHASRLEYFISQAIDTTVRGLVYDAWPVAGADVSAESLSRGAQIVGSLTQLNAIPAIVLASDDRQTGESKDDGDGDWVAVGAAAVELLLGAGAP